MRPRFASLSALLIVILLAAVPACSKNSTRPNPTPQGPTFDSGSFANGKFVFTFTTEGSWGYRCTLHNGMNGTVNVSAAGQDSPLVTILSAPNSFNPATVQVKTGSYVRWVNNGATLHMVTRP